MNLLSGACKKWIHAFEDVNSIIFTVDLASYDRVILEETNQNCMVESLDLFASVVNSGWFMRTSIILMMCNVALFKEKLGLFPFQNYFPDYSGGNDVNRAAKYLLWRFNQVNRAQLKLYSHLVEPGDTTAIHLVFAAVKETLLTNSLWLSENVGKITSRRIMTGDQVSQAILTSEEKSSEDEIGPWEN